MMRPGRANERGSTLVQDDIDDLTCVRAFLRLGKLTDKDKRRCVELLDGLLKGIDR